MLAVIHQNLFPLRNVSERPLETHVGRGGVVDEAPGISWICLRRMFPTQRIRGCTGSQVDGTDTSTNSLSFQTLFSIASLKLQC